MCMPNDSVLDVHSEQGKRILAGDFAYKAGQGSHLPYIAAAQLEVCGRPCLQMTRGDLLEQEATPALVWHRGK